MGEPGWFCGQSPYSELIGVRGERGEVKHLSTCRRRYSVSSGERKRMMAKPNECDSVRALLVGCCGGVCCFPYWSGAFCVVFS